MAQAEERKAASAFQGLFKNNKKLKNALSVNFTFRVRRFLILSRKSFTLIPGQILIPSIDNFRNWNIIVVYAIVAFAIIALITDMGSLT